LEQDGCSIRENGDDDGLRGPIIPVEGTGYSFRDRGRRSVAGHHSHFDGLSCGLDTGRVVLTW
jgi:hypothetical protein